MGPRAAAFETLLSGGPAPSDSADIRFEPRYRGAVTATVPDRGADCCYSGLAALAMPPNRPARLRRRLMSIVTVAVIPARSGGSP